MFFGKLNMAKTIGTMLCCLFALGPISCRADNLHVLVLLSDLSTPYQSLANALTKTLPASIQTTIKAQSDESTGMEPADLIIAVGMKASLSALTQPSAPVLVVMIPKVGYDQLLDQTSAHKNTRVVSAIYFDQSLDQQLSFLRAAFPSQNRIGLLYSPSAHIDLAHLQQQVAEHGAALVAKPVLSSQTLFSTLDDLLGACDILLALPDNKIYNSSTIRNILLSSYRSEIPFIGLSRAYVTAGALGAIYSTPEQVSDQIAGAIQYFARTGKLPEPQHPREFSIALNPDVARSLHIELLPTDEIRSRMDRAHRGAP